MTSPRIALLGGGTVGAELARLIQQHPNLHLQGVLVRDTKRERSFTNWERLVTNDHETLLQNADIIVEVLGGVKTPLAMLEPYLTGDIPLVSANKAVLAERWDAFTPQRTAGKLFFEAAVMGGVPVIGTANTLLRAAELVEFGAVLNGTCNVILAAMEEGHTYEDALRDAQAAGFAEADPTLDVGGFDAAHKLNLLIRMLADPNYSWEQLSEHITGITGVSSADVAHAKAEHTHIRLIGSARMVNGKVEAYVRPERLQTGHPLLTRGVTNAFWYRGEPLGEILLRGPGAGAGPTAAAVFGDVLQAAAGAPGHGQHL